ncbi:hypothetical protein OH76DRAFT_652736 [Lentinus brumalis]|uniref:Uncharacterized protein n=1 Tax=Lentinus brumalis TaxID=2498619 RepID=A0A371CH92_9APHY|nr:hypothetical protein OH76DRAFT_652736 [Polyporus brumalis]
MNYTAGNAGYSGNDELQTNRGPHVKQHIAEDGPFVLHKVREFPTLVHDVYKSHCRECWLRRTRIRSNRSGTPHEATCRRTQSVRAGETSTSPRPPERKPKPQPQCCTVWTTAVRVGLQRRGVRCERRTETPHAVANATKQNPESPTSDTREAATNVLTLLAR